MSYTDASQIRIIRTVQTQMAMISTDLRSAAKIRQEGQPGNMNMENMSHAYLPNTRIVPLQRRFVSHQELSRCFQLLTWQTFPACLRCTDCRVDKLCEPEAKYLYTQRDRHDGRAIDKPYRLGAWQLDIQHMGCRDPYQLPEQALA